MSPDTSLNNVSRQNWATNIQFRAAKYHAPKSIEELQEVVRQAEKVRVVGSGHCFNDIADTTGLLLSLGKLDKSVSIDQKRQTATVSAGMTYVELCPILDAAGYALRNLASIPQITVIGACATATHGSGDGNGNLATQVSGLELVKADGELVQLLRAEHGEKFNGMVVALGALGVVTKVTLDVVPTYSMQQQIYRMLPLTELAENFDSIMNLGYSVSLFTPWRDRLVNQVWVKQVLEDTQPLPMEPTLFGAKLASENVHPLDGVSAEPCTQQMGTPGPWYERLPHFHIRSSMVGDDELQTEYFVAREHAVEAILAVESINEQMHPLLKVSEVRSVAADDLWLSTAYKQDCIGLHFSWHKPSSAVYDILPLIEEKLAPFDARPHWGKMFAMPPERVQEMYPKLADFRALVAEFDPERKLRNSYLERHLAL